MGISDLIQEERFDLGRGGITRQDDEELRNTLVKIIATKPFQYWANAFEYADVPFAQAVLTEEAMTDPQILHNNMIITLKDPELGHVEQMGVPIQLSKTPGKVKGPRTNITYSTDRILSNYPNPTHTNDCPDKGPDPLPLSGIRILEITNLIAGPTGGRLLADLGADVIKLEPPTGDMSRPIGRSYFYNINYNKRSVSIDTSKYEGKELVQKIAATADAVLANLRPNATKRMGIDTNLNPNLIETHLTGYGWTGPYSKRPGIDPLAQALMGLERAQGGPENPPVFPAQLAPTDYTNGAMGALGTILAMFCRLRTGVVQRVDCNLLNSAVVLSSAWFTRYVDKPERQLADKHQYGLTPYHRLYQLKDGWIYLVARNPKEKAILHKLTGVPKPANLAKSIHPNETTLAKNMSSAFAEKYLNKTLQFLKTQGVPALKAQPGDSHRFLYDPHAIANGMVTEVPHPKLGKLRLTHRYICFSNTLMSEERVTPLLGEHTTEVLREIGCANNEIIELYKNCIIKSETP